MKKSILSIVCAVVVAVALSSCGKEVSNTSLLTQEKGWKIDVATINPEYTNADNVTSNDMFLSYFYDFEADDVHYFSADKAIKVVYNTLGEGQTLTEETLGTWAFVGESEDQLTAMFSFFPDPLTYSIIKLDETKLQIHADNVEFVNPETKAVEVYNVDFTFVPAK